MPGDLRERRDRLGREEPLEVATHCRDRHRLVDVHDALESHQIGHARVRRVQHPQLVELPVVHVVGEENADVLEARTPVGELVFDHPLPERLGDDRPAVVDADLVAKPRAIVVRGLRSDAVDHRVGERACRLDEAGELGTPRLADRRHRPTRHPAVAGQVVAAQDRQRFPTADSTGVEPARDRLDRRVGLFERVAPLGDRHRQDGNLRIRNPTRERILVGDREGIVDDAPDDLRARPLAVALDQRVEVILRRKHAGHAAISVESPEPADAPVATRRSELVDIEGEVRAMEPADAEVQDARSQRRAVVARCRHAQRLDACERGCGETGHRRAHPRRGYQARR